MGDGIWAVSVDIAPGTYETTSTGSCYWARLNSFTGGGNDIIANGDEPSGSVTVTIPSGDVGFESSYCGTWTRIG